jgi:hypothetical protein
MKKTLYKSTWGLEVNWTIAFQTAAAILTSLGGAGVIILGLSSYLGKLWADRALEKEKHRYAEILQTAKSDMDRATNRYQVELDSLSLTHKLRMTEEFARLGQMWKRMAILLDAFTGTAGLGLMVVPADADEYQKFKGALRNDFEKSIMEARGFFLQEKLFIPKNIANCAEATLAHAIQEKNLYDIFFNHHESTVRSQYTQGLEERLSSYKDGMAELEGVMREHIEGMKR